MLVTSNPATGEVLRELAIAGEEEVHAAVARARAAQPAWNEMGMRGRVAILRRFQHILHERKEEVARLIIREAGKPYVEALLTEVQVVLGAAGFLIDNASLSIFRIDDGVTNLVTWNDTAHLGPEGSGGQWPGHAGG